MNYNASQPLMVQNDFTMLLEVDHPNFNEVRSELSRFADLIKSPSHLHTYKISPMSLWNAASSGIKAEHIITVLRKFSKYNIPLQLIKDIEQYIHRYGLLRLEVFESRCVLSSTDSHIIQQIYSYASLRNYGLQYINDHVLEINPRHRGNIKQELIKLGYPVEDLIGYHQGESLEINLNMESEDAFQLRDYQISAVEAFYQGGTVLGGNGVLVLPCGSGKTIIGIAAMARLGSATLILTTNVTSVRQWKREIMEKTNLSEELIGEYTGASKKVRPITIATYQILTHRKNKEAEFLHMNLFNERDWGLIIYDEVHLLPAPVFRVTADIQATRRLGLTATLVREDHREEDVFSLVGPKRYDAPWKELEQQGWIASVKCTEIRVPLSDALREQYMQIEPKYKHRFAGENPSKISVVQQLLTHHRNEPTLIIGQYLDQLHQIADILDVPFIHGKMAHDERELLYKQFREGHISLLVVSKVANFAVDLPDASVAIQISGSYGSRQEEAQRLGRILRPKSLNNMAYFYTIVSAETKEQEFAMNRQLFLVEQGYQYQIKDARYIRVRSAFHHEQCGTGSEDTSIST